MYREHTQMSLKRERERQRAAQERDAEHAKLYFRPQISKGSQILARERSRERPVFERLWSPSRTKMNKNTYASSFSQTPVRNRRPSMSPPTGSQILVSPNIIWPLGPQPSAAMSGRGDARRPAAVFSNSTAFTWFAAVAAT